ncbi:MAG: sigma-70 family RNA polymerase sigma factor [Phycisphaerales bacterium]|nr:sigma-70 family RNA polymerase sigma factor [Phycisphaerales bacterium]
MVISPAADQAPPESRDTAPTDDPATDAALVALAQRGDRAAFALLYRRHGPMVHAVVLTRVDLSEAEDITQEVFLLAWRKLGGLHEGSSVGAWLASIARSRAADWRRSRGRRRRHETLASRAESTPDAGAGAVLEAVRTLPQRYREALLMRLLAGLTGAQIAERLGLTPGSVRVHLHRAMTMARARLSEERR